VLCVKSMKNLPLTYLFVVLMQVGYEDRDGRTQAKDLLVKRWARGLLERLDRGKNHEAISSVSMHCGLWFMTNVKIKYIQE
jgi:hypothetical protein